MTSHKFEFSFSPNLIALLGEQLIHDKKIALAELIKNAYDADASYVEIRINGDSITILDNGCGMDLDIIKNVWLQPGVSNKKKDFQNNKFTPIYNRLPLGEKGVGRLGVHRLGNKIEICSKMKRKKDVHFSIDWNKLQNAGNFSKPEAMIVVKDSESFADISKEPTGTYIKITELKETWKKEDFKKLSTQLLQIMPPFSQHSNFEIRIHQDGDFIGSSLTEEIKFIRGNALYHFDITLDQGVIKNFTYQFKPWESIKLAPERKVTSREVSLNKRKSDEYLKTLIESLKLKEILSINSSQNKNNKKLDGIGKITFSGFIYDYSPEIFNKEFNSQDKRKIKDYMKKKGGIRIYRDNMRVYNYGEKGFDILDLDLQRITKRLANVISSNQIAGFVQLERQGSNKLIEKTNREGFIHNETFYDFHNYLDSLMKLINILRKEDKSKIVDLDKISKVNIHSRLEKLKKIIDKSKLNKNDKEKIKKDITSFAEEIDSLKSILLTASNTGINMTFIIHEVDKIIKSLAEKIKQKDISQIKKIFLHLKNTINAYKDIIRVNKKSAELSVDEIIKQAISNAKYRFDCHNIKYEQILSDNLNIFGKRGLVIGILNNLFDNAIYWLDTYEIENKKIIVKAYQDKNFVYFIVADNGKGFNISFETALGPFISGRKEETSMGIGLHLAEQVMIAHDGNITEGNWKEEKLSKEFSKGAVIKLKFRKR